MVKNFVLQKNMLKDSAELKLAKHKKNSERKPASVETQKKNYTSGLNSNLAYDRH